MNVHEVLVSLLLAWLGAKLLGEAMERLGQPSVLGELLAGVMLGPGVLGLIRESAVLHTLAELGVILLLFEIGLGSDVEELARAGTQSAAVALLGIALPFGAGFLLARAWGQSSNVAVFICATLTATSVGISARVLSDLGRLRDAAAQIVLGAAVIDDVLGLVILAVVSGLAQGGSFSAVLALVILGKAVAFLLLAVGLGIRAAPFLVQWIGRMRARGSDIVFCVVFCVLLALVADRVGLATIIGAFAAGLVLARTDRREHMAERIKPVAELFVPLFFVMIGARVEPRALLGAGVWLGLVLTAVAVLSKLGAALAVYRRDVGRWPVAVGMVPRGEVGLIFAGIGMTSGVITGDLYAALVMMVIVTTFIVPPWLKHLYARQARREPISLPRPPPATAG
jgi:Kef-type K+ transport system membrane component KefB